MSVIDELRIRNVDAEIALRLKSMAKKHGMSRSEYVKGILTNHVLSSQVKEVDNQYQELIKTVVDCMEGNAMLLHDILELLKEKEEL